MKSRIVHPQACLRVLASLLVASALLSACGGGSGGSDSSKPMAANQPSEPAASAAVAESASAPASGAATEVATAASAAASSGVAEGATSATPGSSGKTGSGSTNTAGATTGTSSGSLGDAGRSSGGSNVIGVPGGTGIAATVPSGTSATETVAEASVKTAAGTEVVAGGLYIYVETTGNDANTGAVRVSSGSDGPVKSITRAQQLARAKIAAMAAGTIARAPVHVVIASGVYQLKSTLMFTSLDSGTASAPVIYEAAQPGTVLISGGADLGTKTAPATASAITYTAPTDAAAVAGGGQLYVNGRRATLARQPNERDAWFVQRATTVTGEAAGKEGSEAFVPAATNLTWMNSLSAGDRKRAVINMYQAWTTGKHRFSDQVVATNSVRVAPRAPWPFLSQGGVSQRYFIENASAAFDAAGEWIPDVGSLKYIRRDDEAGANLNATLPMLERLVLVQGEIGKPVVNLQFSGLTFGYTRYLTPDTGFTDSQAAYPIAAAIEVNRAIGFAFNAGTVYRTGGWGIWLRDSVRGATITNSRFADLGAGAIKIGLTAQSPTDPTATGANKVGANIISDTGKIFQGAVALFVGQSWDNQLLRNTIYNTTYTAISLGWSWGYATPTSGRNIVTGNLIYNIGQRELADIAGIYTLGRSPGTVISSNIIRSVRGYKNYGAGAWGIYGDEGSSNILIENNVVLGTDGGGFHIHYGKDNIVRGNVFAGGDLAEVRVTKLETDLNLAVQGNLIAPKTTEPFEWFAAAPEVVFSNNQVSSTLSGPGVSITKCGTGCMLGTASIASTTAPTDIRTSNAAGAVTIANAIAAWSGVAVDQLAAKLATLNLPAVADAPTALVAPATDFDAVIEELAVGKRPLNMLYQPAGNLTAVQIAAMADAPAGKCLAFNDSSSYANRWEPLAMAQFNYDTGTTVAEFLLKIDATTVFFHEWRDKATIYQVGPSLRITPAGIEFNGKVMAPMTTGEWTKFQITSLAGSGKWKLEITRANGTKVVFDDIPNKSAGWSRMNWLGFWSDAGVTSTPCIAGLKVSNLK
ncbi:parallel beta-helix repeat protein [Pelomonas aquatica]|uniref:Parallel beta-helix repeat protein n=1 Tax=Pelomonas aquatica TaxID=431058 RepID=A0ABU1Z6X0_9BURK|nr:right-handed parallel beta-helix repeat-containing protein [Pelomonas aquatica]MDR7295725.1 parallel beta-helix repeat protein [Pelomonas aquatica]